MFDLIPVMSEGAPSPKKSKMSNSLAHLKALTTVVADTGDFEGMCLSQEMEMSKVYRFVFRVAKALVKAMQPVPNSSIS